MRSLALLFVLAAACGGGVGSDWTEVDTPAPAMNTSFSIWAFAADDVWLGGTSVWHYDGSTWAEEPVPGGRGVVDFYGFSPNDLWGIGDAAVFRWDGASWTEMPAGGDAFVALWRIWGESASEVWVANTDNSRVYHWDGASWSRQTLQFVQAQALWGSSANDIWVTGPFDAYHWDGSSWTVFDDDPGPGGAWGMWGSAASDVWAVGGTDELVHFDGIEWSAVNEDAFEDFNDVWGSAADDVYAVGNAGTVAHFDGDSWTSYHSVLGGARNFTMVHGSSASNVWATAVDLSTFTGHVYRLER